LQTLTNLDGSAYTIMLGEVRSGNVATDRRGTWPWA